MRIKIDWFNLFIVFSIFLSFITNVFFFNNIYDGYQLILLYPLIYLFVYVFILQDLRNSRFLFVSYGIILMQWIRFVLMPPVITMAGDNPGIHYINPSTDSIILATVLIVYEFFITSCFAWYWMHRKNKLVNPYPKNILGGNKIIYLVFIFVAFLLAITVGIENNLISFFVITLTGEGRRGDVTDTLLVLVMQIIILALFLLFLLTVNWSAKKYKKSRRNIYIYLSLLIAFLNVALIVGERRTAQIYTSILVIWILIKAFPDYKEKIVLYVGGLAVAIISFMSIYKFFGAFLYDSYSEAVVNSNLDVEWFARSLQSYFFGPENVAITLEFAQNVNLNVTDLIFDFARSTFGLSFLFKGDSLLTSQRFNTFVYGMPMSTGHVLSSVGYSYIFFGAVLSPLIAIFNIILAIKAESLMKNTKYIEMVYIWGYVLVRFCTNLFVNTGPLISASTIMLGTGGLLFSTAILFGNKKS